jgi:2-oxo-3-hexenedioate decarboxylase
MTEVASLAAELRDAYAARRTDVTPPSTRDPSFDLTAAYAVEAELARMRRASGHHTVGRKVGFANKAVWRALKLETLVWAHMYDDTVRRCVNGTASLPTASMTSPKIEPEIVFKLNAAIAPDADAAAVLNATEWIALGFEIIDCVFTDWKFQPADFVAAYGLHAALVFGDPLIVSPENASQLAEELPKFRVRLMKNGEVVAEGSGKNSLRSPALCVAELAAAIAKRSDAEPLAPGELISSGTLTDSQLIHAGETWRAEVEGIDLAPLTLTLG